MELAVAWKARSAMARAASTNDWYVRLASVGARRAAQPRPWQFLQLMADSTALHRSPVGRRSSHLPL